VALEGPRRRPTGVRHQHVDAPESRERLRGNRVRAFLRRDVGNDGVDVGAGARRDLGARALERLGITRAHDDRCAFGRELLGDGTAQSTARGGNERDALPQSEVHEVTR
jgi:hypothetical protein